MHLSASRPLVPVVCAPEPVVTPMADFGGSACQAHVAMELYGGESGNIDGA